MAKTTEDEPKRKTSGAQKTLTWLMTGMLIMGIGGFGITNFAGNVTSIGKVGDLPIPSNDYARAVQGEIADFSQQMGSRLSAADALQFGLDRQALQGLVTRTALDNEARKLGLSVGDETVANEILKQKGFIGASGGFDRAIYADTLRRNGWNEKEYEETLRRDVARSLLQGAIVGGINAPDAMVATLYDYIAERRGFSLLRLSGGDLAETVADPDLDTLKAYYEANIAAFTLPEAKRLRVASLLTNDLAKDQTVDEALLQRLYNDHIAEYVVPERRLLERLIYPDAAARDAALAQVQNGRSFEDLVAERGLSLQAADMGDVARSALGPSAEAIFAAPEGAVVAGETDLGPALFRVNGSLPGEERSFEEARAELAEELQYDAARRAIAAKVADIDDLLAGGEPIAQLAEAMGMALSSVDFIAARQGNSPLEGYEAFRKSASAVQAGDFPEAVMLEDGGLVVLEFVELVPAHAIPFEEAQEAVLEQWRADQRKDAISAEAARILAAVGPDAPLESFGTVEKTAEIARDGTLPNAPVSVLSTIFDMAEGESRLIQEGAFSALVTLDTIIPAAQDDDGAQALKEFLALQIGRSLSQDLYDVFSETAANSAGVTLDQTAINLVNSSLQ